MVRVSKKVPQTGYVAINSHQVEWQYANRAVSDTGKFFDRVEEVIASAFLPSLFNIEGDLYRKLAELPV